MITLGQILKTTFVEVEDFNCDNIAIEKLSNNLLSKYFKIYYCQMFR